MYEVIGYEVKQGVKRSTGKPYRIEILHCAVDNLSGDKDCWGTSVESVVFNLLYSGREPKYPKAGDYVRVYYGRTGYPEDYDIV